MTLFFSDLWADLREKRLWPVAVFLVVALVAVPVVLAKPFEAPAPPAPDQTAAQDRLPEGATEVVAASEQIGAGSALDLFDPKDPFRPPETILRRKETSVIAGPSDTVAGPSASDAGAASPGGTPDFGSSGGDSGGTGGGGGGGGGGAPAPPVTRTQRYTYVIDVTFKANSRIRKIKGMRRLDMLPSQRSPLLIFMGVGSGGNNAVFLVDSTLKAFGEGRCKPSNSDCSFVYLGAGSEHQFTNEDGDSYTLRVDQIRRVKVRAASARRSSNGPSASADSRRFVPPTLIDQVDVATTSGGNSSQSQSRR
jgi:hypothetical protein